MTVSQWACVSPTLIILLTALPGLAATAAPETTNQEMMSLPVRVVDADGKPVAGAEVIPWALRCSQGHGPWSLKGYGGSKPPTLRTDAAGRVDVPYPRYTYPDEQVRTTEVTLAIDQPEFAHVNSESINVPHEQNGPYEAKLQRGASVEIVPLQDGSPAALEGLHTLWSDGRSWKPGAAPTVTDDGALRIPPMPAGKGQVLLVRLDGERATYFSPMVDLDLKAGETVRQEVKLRSAMRIEGKLSNNVPRPIKNGRLKAMTLPDQAASYGVNWYTWAPIAEDGTFVIESWPAGETIQIIALCDGYVAESGAVLDLAKHLPATAAVLTACLKSGRGVWTRDSFQRPQMYTPAEQEDPLHLRMEQRVRCQVETVDEGGSVLAGVKVGSWPNVGWWNGGSQIYCHPLVRGERLVIERDYLAAIYDRFLYPFETTTDSNGRGQIELPVGKQRLNAEHDAYELPVVQGSRDQQIELVAGETTNVRLVLQPKGKEYLGEWDKLAGVLFGCTGEECRRLLEDKGFRERIAVVGAKLDSAANPTDPALLSDAYLKMAAAFDEVEDKEEAEKWRRKAAEQAVKVGTNATNSK